MTKLETLKVEIASINERLDAYLNFDSELTANEAMLLSEERERLMNKVEELEEEQTTMTENEFLLTYAGENVTIKFDTLDEVVNASMSADLHKYSGTSAVEKIDGHDDLYGLALYRSGSTPKDRMLFVRPETVETHIRTVDCTARTGITSDGWHTITLEGWADDVILEVELEAWRCAQCAEERCELWNNYIEEVNEGWS